jgi:hypothetical protein
MDDTAQKQNQANDNTQVQAQPQPQVPVQPVAQTPSPEPITPTGTTKKEAEMAPVSDYVRPSEPEPIKDKEVVEAGIAEAERGIKLEEVHEKMGVRLSAESTPVKTQPSGMVQLPLDEKEAEKLVKKGPGHNINLEKFIDGLFFADSVYGLAQLMMKHFKRIQSKLSGQKT